MQFHLLPWEQGWMKMFHGSAAASSPLAHVRELAACVRHWVNVYGETRTPAFVQEAAPHVGVARVCARSCFSRRRFSSLEGYCVKFYTERSAQLQEQIGPKDRAASFVIYLVLWRRSNVHFTAY